MFAIILWIDLKQAKKTIAYKKKLFIITATSCNHSGEGIKSMDISNDFEKITNKL